MESTTIRQVTMSYLIRITYEVILCAYLLPRINLETTGINLL
jgi:hypothetical protein